jgi:hypothetical protein
MPLTHTLHIATLASHLLFSTGVYNMSTINGTIPHFEEPTTIGTPGLEDDTPPTVPPKQVCEPLLFS